MIKHGSLKGCIGQPLHMDDSFVVQNLVFRTCRRKGFYAAGCNL
jgi:hypothetical protein